MCDAVVRLRARLVGARVMAGIGADPRHTGELADLAAEGFDPRFTATYGGAKGAAFVRDALKVYAEHHL